MFGNGKIFISHTHQDNAVCDMLTAALDVWQLDYWIDLGQLSAGQELFAHIHKALTERDIFIRVCTPAAQQSPWMDQEETLARSLRAPNRSGKRFIINLILAPGYRLTEIERQDTVIDATQTSAEHRIHQLRKELGIPAPGRNLNRRAFIGLGVTSLVALGAMGVAGKVLLTPAAIPGYSPQVYMPTSTPQPGASRMIWKYGIGTDSLTLQGVGLSVNESGVYVVTPHMVSALGPTDGALRWQQQSLARFPSQTAPTLAGNTLYVLGTEVNAFPTPLLLLAVNTQNGTQRWQAMLDPDTGDNAIYATAPVTVAGNAIIAQYINTNSATAVLAAFDATTHAPLWPAKQYKITTATLVAVVPDPGLWAAPTVSGNVIYASQPDGNLYAYNLTTGQLLWSYTPTPSGIPIQATPAVVNGVVYVGRDDGYCYAVNATNGTLLWKQSLGSDIVGVSSPTVANGVVYLCAGITSSIPGNPTGPQFDMVCALDAQSGQIRWQAHPSKSAYGGQFPAYPIMKQPLLLNGTLYVTGALAPVTWTKRDVLYALDSTNGNVQWTYVVDGAGTTTDNSGFPSAPVAYNNVVYFASSDATVYALSTR